MTKEEKINVLKDTVEIKPEIYKALELLDCKVGIEVGVRAGQNLKNLAKNSKWESLYGLDCWKEDPTRPEINDASFRQSDLDNQYQGCLDISKENPKVKIVRNFSYEGSQEFEDNYFDFIYIDAAHDYESVVEDLNAWWPKLKDGGIFSGHDYFPDTRIWRGKACGVYQAVNEFVSQKGTEVHHVTNTDKEGGAGVSCNSFFIVK